MDNVADLSGHAIRDTAAAGLDVCSSLVLRMIDTNSMQGAATRPITATLPVASTNLALPALRT